MGGWFRRALAAACVAALAACSAATAAPPTETPEVPRDVEATARDEIAELEALGYPTEIAEWSFRVDFENDGGGTAAAYFPDRYGDPIRITLSATADDYDQYESTFDVAVRSAVRHEFGHALMYRFGYDSDADELGLRAICPDRASSIPDDQNWGHECAAEVIGVLLAEARGEEQLVTYDGLTISDTSRWNMSSVVRGSLSW